MDAVVFTVGGAEFKAPVPLTVQRLSKIWPAVVLAGSVTNRLEQAKLMCQIVGVTTEADEDLIDRSTLEDMGRIVERKLLSTEIDGLLPRFQELMQKSGLGPSKPGEGEAASLSTGTGTQ